MKLCDFVSAERVLVPMAVATLAEATEALLARVESSAAVRDAAKLRRRMDESRDRDLVVVGDRAFLLHFRADSVRTLRVALGVAPEPIVRGVGPDDAHARVVVLVVAPPREAARHIQLVRAFARLLSQPDAVDSILSAESAEDVAGL